MLNRITVQLRWVDGWYICWRWSRACGR